MRPPSNHEFLHQPEFGRCLKAVRAFKDLTQKETAALLSISATEVGRWERGDAYPDTSEMQVRILAVLPELNEFRRWGHREAHSDTSEMEAPIPPDAPKLPGIEFDIRMEQERESKKRVARAAVINVLNLCPTEIFIGDGTEAVYFSIELFREWRSRKEQDDLTVHTNNIGVVDAYMQWARSHPVGHEPIKLKVVSGELIVRIAALRGTETEDWIRANAPRCISVICTSWLDALKSGPQSGSDAAAKIKLSALEHSRILLVLLSRSKLGVRRQNSDSSQDALTLVRSVRTEWQNRLQGDHDKKLLVIADLCPSVRERMEQDATATANLNEQEIEELRHAKWLHQKLGPEGFIIVESE